MTATYLAAANSAFHVGVLVAALGLPTVGWVLVVIGLKQRSHSRPQPEIRRRQDPTPAEERPSGTRLIAIGAVLIALGVLVIAARLMGAG